MRPLRALTLLALVGCAHTPDDGRAPLHAVDVVDAQGAGSTLAFTQGKVTVVDVCAAWADACLINAREISQACESVCGDDVAMVSILLDETGPQAIESYYDVLGAQQQVFSPGARARAGDTVLGELTGVPVLYLFDADGDLVERVDGAVINAPGLVRRVKDLL